MCDIFENREDNEPYHREKHLFFKSISVLGISWVQSSNQAKW